MSRGIIPDAATRWARYRIGYHLVWIPKYRRPILTPEVGETVRTSLRAACADHDLTLLACETDRDHVHVFVSARPAVSPAHVARLLKGASSRAVRRASASRGPVRSARPLGAELLRRDRRGHVRGHGQTLY